MKKPVILAALLFVFVVGLVAATVLVTLKVSTMGKLEWVPSASAEKAAPSIATIQPQPTIQSPKIYPFPATREQPQKVNPAAQKASLACLGGNGEPCVVPQSPPPTPIEKSVTVALLPGQKFNLPNDKFEWVMVHSRFPVRVINGKCSNDYTVEFGCTNQIPEYLYIEDRRNPPVFGSPEGNDVTLTLRTF
jgi:hypothetical protein